MACHYLFGNVHNGKSGNVREGYVMLRTDGESLRMVGNIRDSQECQQLSGKYQGLSVNVKDSQGMSGTVREC